MTERTFDQVFSSIIWWAGSSTPNWNASLADRSIDAYGGRWFAPSKWRALPLSLALAILGLTGANSALAKPVTANRAPHVLSTSELKLLLVGTRVTKAYIPPGQPRADDPEYFGRNGFYGRAADNYEQRGKYHIANNLVCVSADGETWCRFVLVDSAGDYWLIKTLAPAEFKKIKVTKSKL